MTKECSNNCGGFEAPKGHLDTQLFPECKDTETDRDIVKKNRKHKKKVHAKYEFPIVSGEHGTGIWDAWLNKQLSDKEFVGEFIKHIKYYAQAISRDPTVRNGIAKAINEFAVNKNYTETAKKISSFLSMGKDVSEDSFARKSFNLKQYRSANRA